MIDIRFGRCGRHGRLSVRRLLAQYGADAPVRRAMQDQIADCPKRDATQIQERCDLHCPTLAQLFGIPEPR